MAVGDALAAPVHWFYDTANIDVPVSDMRTPAKTHKESMLSGMSYTGSINILHDKASLYEGHSLDAELSAEEIKARSDTHGNFLGVQEDERAHYHQSLQRGQNTVNICLARLLARYLGEVCAKGQDGYDPHAYLARMETYMTTAPSADPATDVGQVQAHNDTYLDVYCRYFFEQASKGVPLMQCAHNQRESWSIGSLDGLLMTIPLLLAYIDEPEAFLVGRAVEHHMLTHRSVTVTAVVAVLAPLLQQLYRGANPDEALDAAMEKMRPPVCTGLAMRESYVRHKGPGRIPKDEKWQQHMQTVPHQTLREYARDAIARNTKLQDVAGWVAGEARFSTACYCEQTMSVVLFLAAKFGDDAEAALSANAEIGGHSTARGAVLGAILGARVGAQGLPSRWIDQLAAPEQVAAEADAIVAVVQARAAPAAPPAAAVSSSS